ncbi:MAG: tRNA (adenosine(37)-N6)-dimethylallyltransferase MiaA, partial [Actinobacteria bacterium]|nr:tRNA (adenosine(37)-N6)-dimethylallyltransferase MiaA [Actinomycetota bacterium]
MIPAEAQGPLIVVAGPTAAGKSALALELARAHGGVIVSADSRQVYREFDIGTGKPTEAERAAVPHDLIDVAEPTETYTAACFVRDARAAIASAQRAGRLPFLVGGTGFYIRALLGGTAIPEVAP